MTSLRDNILKKIQEEHIVPRARWTYTVQYAVLWILLSLTLMAGMLAVAYFLFELGRPERPFLGLVSGPRWVDWLPWIWAVGAVICSLFSIVFFAKTERGYRVAWYWIIGILVGGSLLGGGVLHMTGAVERADGHMRRLIPPYERVRRDMQRGIPTPEMGMLPGRIESGNGSVLRVRTPLRDIWTVEVVCDTPVCQELMREPFEMRRPLIFRGAVTGEYMFRADDIVVDMKPLKKLGPPRNNQRGGG